MPAFIVTALIGVVCIILGITHTKGNISSLHSYHRNRVADEDVLPFGKLVGAGTITIGISIIIFSIFNALTVYLDKNVFSIIGTTVLMVGIVVGCILSFYAMIKYNKGIF